MPDERAKHFFDAFRQIPQRVVWRYTGTLPDDVPENARVMKWLPQNDLLAHSESNVFMTHGGSHGIYEGNCNGVPMVMFPLFGDQKDNVSRIVARGVAEELSINYMTGDTLVAAMKKIIHDKRYKEQMVTMSQIHLDRPVQPIDLAAFHSLDVIGFLLIVIITVLWLTLKSCLFCTPKYFRKRNAKKKSE